MVVKVSLGMPTNCSILSTIDLKSLTESSVVHSKSYSSAPKTGIQLISNCLLITLPVLFTGIKAPLLSKEFAVIPNLVLILLFIDVKLYCLSTDIELLNSK